MRKQAAMSFFDLRILITPLGIFKLFLHADRFIFGSLDCYRKTTKNYSAIEYTSPGTGSEITTLMAIDTDYIG